MYNMATSNMCNPTEKEASLDMHEISRRPLKALQRQESLNPSRQQQAGYG